MTKIKNNATQQLNEFVVEHFKQTETNSSANTISKFAELVLGWFNETLTENESIVFETIENQIFTMAKYNRGGLKDASGFLKQEINRTFENNVKSAVQLAHVWYSKENKDVSRNTKQSKYFYIANNKMVVKSNFSNANKSVKEKNEYIRLPLSEINDFYNNVFEIKKGKTERKNFLNMLEGLNTSNYKPLSHYPFIKFDLSFKVNRDLNANDLIQEVENLLQNNENSIKVFDDYAFEKTRNLGIRIITRSYEKTYNEKETTEILNMIVDKLTSKFNITLNEKGE